MTWPEMVTSAVGLLYLAASAGFWMEGKIGLSMAFMFYAAANAGLILASRGQ